MPQQLTYLLVDGENIDATLGGSILGRRPRPEERPRWNVPLAQMEERWDQPAKGLFYLAVDGDIPASFVQALMAIGYQPIMLSGAGKVVDIAIQKTLAALASREDDVMLLSHDGDFAPQMHDLAELTGRRLGLMGFREFFSHELTSIPGIEVLDLEYDIAAFTTELPRLRVIPIDEFDPLEFL